MAMMMIPKYINLRDGVENGTTVEEMRAAWSKLSISERNELTSGVGPGQEGSGGVHIFFEMDYSPLHKAVCNGNFAAVRFFLVSVYYSQFFYAHIG